MDPIEMSNVSFWLFGAGWLSNWFKHIYVANFHRLSFVLSEFRTIARPESHSDSAQPSQPYTMSRVERSVCCWVSNSGICWFYDCVPESENQLNRRKTRDSLSPLHAFLPYLTPSGKCLIRYLYKCMYIFNVIFSIRPLFVHKMCVSLAIFQIMLSTF